MPRRAGSATASTRGCSNDVGSFEVQVKVADALRPGQVIIDHAWEPYQFRGRRSHQALIPSPINPIQLAGGYFHLQATPLYGEPGANDRGTRVEVERIEAGTVLPLAFSGGAESEPPSR